MNRVMYPAHVIPSRLLATQRVYSRADSMADRGMLRFFLMIAIAVVVGLLYLWVRVQVLDAGYAINRLEKIKSQLTLENRALSVEVALLKSPERIEGIATNQLNLVVPDEAHFIYLNETRDTRSSDLPRLRSDLRSNSLFDTASR